MTKKQSRLPRFQIVAIQYGWRVWDRESKERVRDFLHAGSSGEHAASAIKDALNAGDLTLEAARTITSDGIAALIEDWRAS